MRILTTVLAAAVALSIASPVYAQTTGTSSSQKKPSTPKKPAPPLPKPKMNFRAFGTFEVEMMSASDTFKAVTGSSSVIGYGGGGEVLNLWKTLFVRGDIVLSSTSGERAFAIGDEVISTGIPISTSSGPTSTRFVATSGPSSRRTSTVRYGVWSLYDGWIA